MLCRQNERSVFPETTGVQFSLRIVPCEMSLRLVETITSISQRFVVEASVRENLSNWPHNVRCYRYSSSVAVLEKVWPENLFVYHYVKDGDAENEGFPVPNI